MNRDDAAVLAVLHGGVGQLPLVGLIEIAMRAGVRRPVASVWRTRHPDFPQPVADLAVGPVFWWPAVQAWLQQTGRRADANITREDTRVPWRSQHGLDLR